MKEGVENLVEFVELVFPVEEQFGTDERDAVEEALEAKLSQRGIGEVSGSGLGLGLLHLDIDIDEKFHNQIEIVRETISEVLQHFRLPTKSTIRFHPSGEKKLLFRAEAEA